MANRKDKGNDGKKNRVKQSQKGDGNECIMDESCGVDKRSPIMLQSGFRGSDIVCAYGHELVEKGIAVTIGNCAGNLYSEVDPVCNVCGVCRGYTLLYGQSDNIGTIGALEPQAPIGYEERRLAA